MPTVSGVIVMDAFLLGITSLISSYVFAKLQRKASVGGALLLVFTVLCLIMTIVSVLLRNDA